MEDAAGPEDIVFRVGGDEFVILTGSCEKEYAQRLCDEIVSHNEEVIIWEGKEIPLSLYVKPVLYEGGSNLKYAEFFKMIHSEMSNDFKKEF